MFASLLDSAKRLVDGTGAGAGDKKPRADTLFPKVDRAVDGDDCDRDCDSCTIKYPASFDINEKDALYGEIKGFSTHLLVATGKSDWTHDVEKETGSVMEAIGAAAKPRNGKMRLSASNIPTPTPGSTYADPTTVLLLPAFTIVENVTPASVPTLISEIVDKAPTSTSPLLPDDFSSSSSSSLIPRSVPVPSAPSAPPLTTRPCPHAALILLCSQRTRDARCGQSAPLLRRELRRHLAPLGLDRDPDDERPGGVGVYFVSHVGGHKYSANVIVYRRPNAFGVDDVERATALRPGEVLMPRQRKKMKEEGVEGGDGEEEADAGAAQCIWLARIRPEDCEGLVKFTVLQGKTVHPERQLRGGFDRARGLLSW